MTVWVTPLQERRKLQTLLEISEVAVDLFAERGFAETTVEEVARTAGVSVRTFHRYFPAKEDAVSPVLDAAWQAYLAAFAARPENEPVLDGLVAALAESLDGQMMGRHLTFLRTLPGSPALAPTWLRVHDRCQAGLQQVLASRLGLGPDTTRARFAAASVIAANRIAVETWADDPAASVADTARACLELIDQALLRPHAEGNSS
jgi:AcrR family transcriptional regulator